MDPSLPYTPAKFYHSTKLKKNGKLVYWYVYFFEADPSTGKKIMVKRTSRMNYIHDYKKRLAYGKELQDEINKELKKGWSTLEAAKQETALEETIDKMYSIKKEGLRYRSKTSYKYSIDIFKEWLKNERLNLIPPEQFTKKLAFAFTDYLVRTKGYSGGNFNNHKTYIGALFTMMEDREIIIKNPFSKIKSHPKFTGSNPPFSDEEIKILSDALMIQDYRLYLFTRLMYLLLIRAEELTRIQIKHIDFLNWRVKLEPGLQGQAKTKLGRTIEIPEDGRSIIKSMELEKYPKHFYVFGKEKRVSLIPAETQITRNIATTRHLKIARLVGIPGELTLTSWRDTGAIHAKERYGIDIYKISQQFGHTSIKTTEIYLASIRRTPNLEFASKMKKV